MGVDSGNSKTVALVARADGRVVGWGRGGGGDIYVSEADAVAAVTEAVEGALAAAGVGVSALTASCLSLVGADWLEDFDFWRLEAQRRGYPQVLVVNDAIGALRAGTAGDGVAVVCGTGAAIGARRGGMVWHSSFWQEPMGGAVLGERALRLIYRAELSLGPATLLTDKVLAYFDLPTVEAVLHRLTARRTRGLGGAGVAALARLLLDAAAEGDEAARFEVASAAVTLAEYAWVAACKVGLQGPFPLVLAGGVLRHPSLLLREALVTHLKTRLPYARPIITPFEPVVGALLLALELAPGASQPSPEEFTDTLTQTLPEAAFFST